MFHLLKLLPFLKKTKQKTIYIGIEMLVFWATWWQSFD